MEAVQNKVGSKRYRSDILQAFFPSLYRGAQTGWKNNRPQDLYPEPDKAVQPQVGLLLLLRRTFRLQRTGRSARQLLGGEKRVGNKRLDPLLG